MLGNLSLMHELLIYADLKRGIMIHQALVQGLQVSSQHDHHAEPPLWPARVTSCVSYICMNQTLIITEILLIYKYK